MPYRTRVGLTLSCLLPFLACAGPVRSENVASYVGSLTWHESSAEFGGYSGLDVSADGTTFTVLSDRATIRNGRLLRDASGKLTGVDAGPSYDIRDMRGHVLKGGVGDSEGLAVAPDGKIWVSFEGNPKLYLYNEIGGRARPAPMARWFHDLPSNGGMEALALADDGTLVSMAEEEQGDRITVFTYRDGDWQREIRLTRDQEWKPVGADFGPDGRFYLLERGFHGLAGFSTRVRVFDLPVGKKAVMPVSEVPLEGETLLETRTGEHDNLEGLAVWRDTGGALRLTMISDDNQLFIQKTEFVEYRLPD